MAGSPFQLVRTIDTNTLALFCPAKINLALSVGPRNTEGLHTLASWMAPIAFGDRMQIQRLGDSEESRFTIQFSDEVPTDASVDWPLEQDLAYRAHQLMQRITQKKLPIQMTLKKHVPAGAGLGGGSADAAGMLDGLNVLFNRGLRMEALLEMANELGSDTIFQTAMRAHATGAIVTGTGEQIKPLTQAIQSKLLLIFPGVPCNTAAVYQAFDHDSPQPSPPNPQAIQRLSQHPPESAKLFNDLESAASLVQPRVGQVLAKLRSMSLAAYLTGSGSAIFIPLPEHYPAIKSLSQRILSATNSRVIATRFWENKTQA